MSTWLSRHREIVRNNAITNKYEKYFGKNVVIKQLNNHKINDLLLSEDADNIYLETFGILGKSEIKLIRLA